MSALPPKADIAERDKDVRFVPKADSCSAAIGGRNGPVHAASTCRSTITGSVKVNNAQMTRNLANIVAGWHRLPRSLTQMRNDGLVHGDK
jgi:hypothetical protein